MMLLRWCLGAIAALFLAGWFALGTLAGGFRRSFGASETSSLLTLVPLAVALLLLVSAAAPAQRGLLQLSAIVMIGVMVASLWVLRESVLAGVFGLAYGAAWLCFCWVTLHPAASLPPPAQ